MAPDPKATRHIYPTKSITYNQLMWRQPPFDLAQGRLSAVLPGRSPAAFATEFPKTKGASPRACAISYPISLLYQSQKGNWDILLDFISPMKTTTYAKKVMLGVLTTFWPLFLRAPLKRCHSEPGGSPVRNLLSLCTGNHGDREMPIWGPIFHQVEADQDWGRSKARRRH